MVVVGNDPVLNPYSPSAELVTGPNLPTGGDQPQSPPARASFLRTFVRWFVVCTISAVPSFMFGTGVAPNQIAAMVIGIAMFVVGYTMLDYATAATRFRQDRRVSRTLKIAYGSRIAASIIFPIAFFLDMICGMVSMSLTAEVLMLEHSDPGEMGFVATLFTTIVQGFVLNAVIAVYALVVHVIQLVVLQMRS